MSVKIICSLCKTGLEIRDKYSYRFYVCPKCGTYKSDHLSQCCEKPDLYKVKLVTENGSIQLRDQCKSCGYITPRSMPKNGVYMDSLPFADKDARERRLQEVYDYKQKIHNWSTLKAEERRIEWLKKHEEVIQSDEWYEKRELVKLRDNFICQCCLKNEATEVHHRSYNSLGNEPCYDLISLCHECHSKHKGTSYIGGTL